MAKNKNKAAAVAPEAVAEPTAPRLTEEEVAAVKTELQALRARVMELEGVLASEQVWILNTSTVVKPVQLVREIFLGMLGDRRRDVVAKCVTAGIAENTAKTQYQILKKKLENGELDEDIQALQAACAG